MSGRHVALLFPGRVRDTILLIKDQRQKEGKIPWRIMIAKKVFGVGEKDIRDLVGLVWFNGTSTIVGYLMPNSFLNT